MPLSAGTTLGAFEILGVLGAGGMGEVCRARDTRLDRSVAIKVLPSQISESPERRQRFEQEARAISRLSHPHICALYDVGREDGTDLLVMELLEGESLADRLARGRMGLEEALACAIQVAGALDAAHSQGIIRASARCRCATTRGERGAAMASSSPPRWSWSRSSRCMKTAAIPNRSPRSTWRHERRIWVRRFCPMTGTFSTRPGCAPTPRPRSTSRPLDAPSERRLVMNVEPRPAGAFYVDPGFVLFRREGALSPSLSIRCRSRRAEARSPSPPGWPVPADRWPPRRRQTAPSDTYSNEGSRTRLVWRARDGSGLGQVGPDAGYWTFALSHDGRRVAANPDDPVGLHVYDVSRGTPVRLGQPVVERRPVWSPDDREMFFWRAGGEVLIEAAEGGEERTLGAIFGENPARPETPLSEALRASRLGG